MKSPQSSSYHSLHDLTKSQLLYSMRISIKRPSSAVLLFNSFFSELVCASHWVSEGGKKKNPAMYVLISYTAS